MTNSHESPYAAEKWKCSKPLSVKEWGMKKLKEGYSPKRVLEDIKKLFGVDVALITIYRWRDRYTSITGERIEPWRVLNKTTEQKRQNGSERTKRQEKPNE